VEKTVITYGTFDLFHIGHLRLLQRLKGLGDRIIVGISTDEFNMQKGKKCIIPYEQRAEIVQNMKQVDLVIPEQSWEQKRLDITRYQVDIFAMGSDWEGRFDDLSSLCEVTYLKRTDGISSTELRELLSNIDREKIDGLKRALEVVLSMAEGLN